MTKWNSRYRCGNQPQNTIHLSADVPYDSLPHKKDRNITVALHKTRSWGRYSYHKLSLFNKCSPISDDIGVCVILAKSVHSKPQVVRCTDCHRHPQFSAVHPTRLVASLREWKIQCFFRHIWSKYAMDGYIACTSVCLRDLDGGR